MFFYNALFDFIFVGFFRPPPPPPTQLPINALRPSTASWWQFKGPLPPLGKNIDLSHSNKHILQADMFTYTQTGMGKSA